MITPKRNANSQRLTILTVVLLFIATWLWWRIFPRSADHVSAKEVGEFTHQLSQQMNEGQPLTQSISTLAEKQQNKYFQQVLRKVQSKIIAGNTLSSAMAQYPDVFDSNYIRVVSDGEKNANLDVAIQQLSQKRYSK